MVACQDDVPLYPKVGRNFWDHIQSKTYSSNSQSLLMKTTYSPCVWTLLSIIMQIHLSWLMSVFITNYFCLWIAICCCSLLLKDCLLLPFVQRCLLFWMSECARLLSAHMAPRGRVGVSCSFSKYTSVLRSGGSCCKAATGEHGAITWAEFGSEDVKQTHCKWHFYLLAIASPPPTSFIYWDLQCHFQEPHGNSRTCQRGDNFLMMSPCHVDLLAVPCKGMKLAQRCRDCNTIWYLDLVLKLDLDLWIWFLVCFGSSFIITIVKAFNYTGHTTHT